LENWRLFYEGLKKYEDYFILPKAANNSDPSWFGFLLTVKENAPFSRNEITNYLEENKIATRLLFSGNIIRHPSFENVKYRIYDNLKNTDTIMNNTFWIGVYPGLTEVMVDFILDKLDLLFKHKS
jgi:CDP-6-deoxy-D-xylo-4-hexulose-3-dehydrase